MLTGYTPFNSKNLPTLHDNIINSPVNFPNQARRPHSDEFEDIVNKLLNKDKIERIGAQGGATEILQHPWFADMDRSQVE